MTKRILILFILSISIFQMKTMAYPVKTTKSQTHSDAELCLNAISKAEFNHNIPQQLLAGIARVESGKFDPVSKDVRPWPWTLCVKGKGEFFTSREATLKRMRVLIGQGVKNFDVGCAQLNWQYHGKKFKSPEHMLEPVSNVDQAAKFLKAIKGKAKAWSNTVGAYHSPGNKGRAQRYAKKVFLAWSKEKKAAYQDRRRALAANTSKKVSS